MNSLGCDSDDSLASRMCVWSKVGCSWDLALAQVLDRPVEGQGGANAQHEEVASISMAYQHFTRTS